MVSTWPELAAETVLPKLLPARSWRRSLHLKRRLRKRRRPSRVGLPCSARLLRLAMFPCCRRHRPAFRLLPDLPVAGFLLLQVFLLPEAAALLRTVSLHHR